MVGHGELWSAQMLAAAVRKVCQQTDMCNPILGDEEFRFEPC